MIRMMTLIFSVLLLVLLMLTFILYSMEKSVLYCYLLRPSIY